MLGDKACSRRYKADCCCQKGLLQLPFHQWHRENCASSLCGGVCVLLCMIHQICCYLCLHECAPRATCQLCWVRFPHYFALRICCSVCAKNIKGSGCVYCTILTLCDLNYCSCPWVWIIQLCFCACCFKSRSSFKCLIREMWLPYLALHNITNYLKLNKLGI